MALALLKEKGVPIDKQGFTWKDLVQAPYSKLTDDAFTRVRVILMNGIESEAVRFSHACARMNARAAGAAGRVRRVEQHQQTLVNWLNPADQTPLETTIGFEQVAIEVTASVAQKRAGPLSRPGLPVRAARGLRPPLPLLGAHGPLEGKDANTLVQSYSDIVPGRPTVDRAPAPAGRPPRGPTIAAQAAADHQAPRPDHHGRGAPDARLLHDDRPDVRRSDRPPALRRDRLDRGAARHPVRVDHRSRARPGSRSGCCTRRARSTTTGAAWSPRRTRASSRSGSASSSTSSATLRFVAELFQEIEGRDAAEVLPDRLPEPIQYDEPPGVRPRGAARRGRPERARHRVRGPGRGDPRPPEPTGTR